MLVEPQAQEPELETPTMVATTKGKPRWRFTIASMTLAIAVIAGVLALPSVARVLAGLLCIASLYLIAARRIVEGGTRNRPLAAGTFWAVALCVNLVAVICCLPPDYLVLGTVFLGLLLVGIPSLVAFGIAWVRLMDGEGAAPPRSVKVGGLLVFIMALLPMVTLGTFWPLSLAFFNSRPAFERMADQVAAGRTLVFPQYVGLFQINGTELDPVSGNVGLMIEPDRSHPAGFVRLGPGPAASLSSPFSGSNLHVELGGKWSYREED
jgi:hypothetical protein